MLRPVVLVLGLHFTDSLLIIIQFIDVTLEFFLDGQPILVEEEDLFPHPLEHLSLIHI